MSKIMVRDNQAYTFINTKKKGVYITENIDEAISFLQKLKILDNGMLAVANSKKKLVKVNNIKNIYITVQIEGELEEWEEVKTWEI